MSVTALAALLAATMLTPAGSADMTFERALRPPRSRRTGCCITATTQGHRFSALKDINTGNVKNLKLVFTVALGGFESGGRYKFGTLEAHADRRGRRHVCARRLGLGLCDRRLQRPKGAFRWKMDPGTDRAWAGDVACCGVNNRGVALWKDKVISVTLDGRLIAINKATGEVVWERKIADPALARRSRSRR